MSKRRRTIALLMDYVRGEYQSEVRFGVERAAEAHDVNLVIAFGETLAPPGGRQARPRTACITSSARRAVDGIIVASTTLCHSRRHRGDEAVLPVLRAAAGLPASGWRSTASRASWSTTASGSRSRSYIVEDHGCQRVAYIGGPPSNEEAEVRADAYRRALADRSLRCDERLVAFGSFMIDTGRAAMRESSGAGSRSTPWSPPTTTWRSGPSRSSRRTA